MSLNCSDTAESLREKGYINIDAHAHEHMYALTHSDASLTHNPFSHEDVTEQLSLQRRLALPPLLTLKHTSARICTQTARRSVGA